MGERAVFSTHAHVFQIDPKTKKKWLAASQSAVRVAFYHDPSRSTYRIIAIESNKALVNSTITANMNFTKTSPKFGQWSDHRANTVYGLGFSAEKELNQFVEKFTEAKAVAQDLMTERQLAAQKAQEQEKVLPPAGTSPSPTSPHTKSPSVISPPAMSGSGGDSINSSPSLLSPISPASIDVQIADDSSTTSRDTRSSGDEIEPAEERKVSETHNSRTRSLVHMNGEESRMESTSSPRVTNGHATTPETESFTTVSNDQIEALTQEIEALKHDNNRLKMALATSGTNAKKWESETQTLKNNNTRLKTALEESTKHVSQWKQQLQKYKEENDSFRIKIKQHAQATEDIEAIRRENEELKEVLTDVQLDLEAKTEDLQFRSTEMESLEQQLEEANSKLRIIDNENQSLNGQVSLLEDQLKMASVASKRKLEDVQTKHTQLGDKLRALLELHRDIESHLST